MTVTFQNNYGASRKWTIWDTGIDPNAPAIIFNNYLDVNAVTGPLTVYDLGAGQGKAQYQRSDGPLFAIDVSDGSTVPMN
jgi:hypothetical protein